jgi:hypothetical protein
MMRSRYSHGDNKMVFDHSLETYLVFSEFGIVHILAVAVSQRTVQLNRNVGGYLIPMLLH